MPDILDTALHIYFIHIKKILEYSCRKTFVTVFHVFLNSLSTFYNDFYINDILLKRIFDSSIFLLAVWQIKVDLRVKYELEKSFWHINISFRMVYNLLEGIVTLVYKVKLKD